jgi:hypothetical protein
MPLPEPAAAIVLSWDHENAHIVCPFCGEEHRHGTSFKNLGHENTRVAHCNGDLQVDLRLDLTYRLIFPFEDDPLVSTLSYIIDKRNRKFYTVGLAGREPIIDDANVDFADDITADFGRLGVSGGGGQSGNVRPDNTEEEIWFLSHCILNELSAIRELFGTSHNRATLLYCRDQTTGNTALTLAATEGHLDTMQLLFDCGACSMINCTNDEGRTPLMQASLWGHANVAQFLLKNNANQQLKDREGLTALDLCQENQRNWDERARKAVMVKMNEKEFQRSYRQRKIIAAFLGGGIPVFSAPVLRLDNNDQLRVLKTSATAASTISLLTPSLSVSVESIRKTIGVLSREGPFNVVNAMSGWSSTNPDLIDNRYWTSQVLSVCQRLGYEMAQHEYDNQGEAEGKRRETECCFFVSRREVD